MIILRSRLKKLNRYWILELASEQEEIFTKYLVKWKYKPVEDATWISQSKLDLAQVVRLA